MINTISDKTALPAATLAVDGDAVGAARGHIVDSGEQVWRYIDISAVAVAILAILARAAASNSDLLRITPGSNTFQVG